MKVNVGQIENERSAADWDDSEISDVKAAKAYILSDPLTVIDPELAPMISSVLDSAKEWLDVPKNQEDLPPEPEIHVRLLKHSLQSLQQTRTTLQGPEQQRVDKLIDEIARFVKEKDDLLKRKTIRS